MGFLVTDNFENEDHCLQGMSEVSPDKLLRKIFRFLLRPNKFSLSNLSNPSRI